MQLTDEPGVKVPWDDREWFGGVIPMRVVLELAAPVGDSFTNATGRVGLRFGFNNTVLQHIFEEVPAEVTARVAEVFSAAQEQVGQPFEATAPPSPVAACEPFDVDPDAADRALTPITRPSSSWPSGWSAVGGSLACRGRTSRNTTSPGRSRAS